MPFYQRFRLHNGLKPAARLGGSEPGCGSFFVMPNAWRSAARRSSPRRLQCLVRRAPFKRDVSGRYLERETPAIDEFDYELVAPSARKVVTPVN